MKSRLLTCCSKKGCAAEKSSKKVYQILKNRQTKRRNFSSAHKPDGLDKVKERAPRFRHIHLQRVTGHTCERTAF
jgi:hypothetical protein